MRPVNWRTGFFRAWVLVLVLWAVAWSIIVLPSADKKIALARMTDAELLSKLADCKVPAGAPAPPKGFYLDSCLTALDQKGRRIERWGGGDSYAEETYRIARSFAGEVALLVLPPVGLLFGGTILGWIFVGFTKERMSS